VLKRDDRPAVLKHLGDRQSVDLTFGDDDAPSRVPPEMAAIEPGTFRIPKEAEVFILGPDFLRYHLPRNGIAIVGDLNRLLQVAVVADGVSPPLARFLREAA